MSKANPFEVFQADLVSGRKAFIEQALAYAKTAEFPSLNKLAKYLATRLSAHEKAKYDEEYENQKESNPYIEYSPPKKVSRQIFYRNEEYRALCDAFLAQKKLAGTKSIKPSSSAEHTDVLLLEKELEISNLKAKVKQLSQNIEQSSRIEAGVVPDADCEATRESLKKLTSEKSLTTQALISAIQWGKEAGLLDYIDGEVRDLAFDRTVIQKKFLKHIHKAITNGLSEPR